MKQLLVIVDPLGGAASVQSEVLLSIAQHARPEYRISVFAPYCSAETAETLRRTDLELLIPKNLNFAINRILARFGRRNESMLWAEAWLREATFRWNRMDAERTLSGRSFDHVLNMSMTVSYPSDLWWIQGLPLDETLHGMATTNLAARFADLLARPLIRWLDRGIAREIRATSAQVIANSPFLCALYRGRGAPVEGVVFSLKDFTSFRPSTVQPSRDYVLMYIGKETESLNYEALRSAGVRIVAFGAKIPATTHLESLTDWIDFRGFVSEVELVRLYSNAKFTLFPFSCEPFGFVPLESMACGTPVLTFNRQGPAWTVVHERTGWLVGSPKDMIRKATELWRQPDTGISARDCVERVQAFSSARSASEVIGRLELTPPTSSWRQRRPSPRLSFEPSRKGTNRPLDTSSGGEAVRPIPPSE